MQAHRLVLFLVIANAIKTANAIVVVTKKQKNVPAKTTNANATTIVLVKKGLNSAFSIKANAVKNVIAIQNASANSKNIVNFLTKGT